MEATVDVNDLNLLKSMLARLEMTSSFKQSILDLDSKIRVDMLHSYLRVIQSLVQIFNDVRNQRSCKLVYPIIKAT